MSFPKSDSFNTNWTTPNTKNKDVKINAPGIITSRLCAGVKIGSVTISIEYSPREGNSGRTRYRYYLDSDNGKPEHEGDDLQSGCQGGNLQFGLANLLSFLSAAGEGYAYEMHDGCESENTDLFPEWVNEWAYQYSGELSLLVWELEEGALSIFEE